MKRSLRKFEFGQFSVSAFRATIWPIRLNFAYRYEPWLGLETDSQTVLRRFANARCALNRVFAPSCASLGRSSFSARPLLAQLSLQAVCYRGTHTTPSLPTCAWRRRPLFFVSSEARRSLEIRSRASTSVGEERVLICSIARAHERALRGGNAALRSADGNAFHREDE